MTLLNNIVRIGSPSIMSSSSSVVSGGEGHSSAQSSNSVACGGYDGGNWGGCGSGYPWGGYGNRWGGWNNWNRWNNCGCCGGCGGCGC
ncbi:hypothetical protein SAMD00019534_002190 [Acytostelium subglobosum LB1]|uniref:hypothetical protein n=1 Tax=Acytostelium subglobosum LB1 TaxID=1410327 RepID=UPI000644B1C8|nr:hypothetical protein SAMD00019534_002190 [Acytostelium subglobosum LB1]GAM17044.1 hypothetical protein SAMD00019534_002190 [Acytostelium subglobosum LB1]|eukprot:XP_012759106.1 hypothetical protein SAMD00019534_002190 [Acytostelium subglobosum LB1]